MSKFKDALKKSFEIIKLNRETIKEVMEDKEAFLPALVIVGIGGIPLGIWSIFRGYFIGIIIAPVALVAISFVATGIVFVIAYLLGGKGRYISLYKVLGYAYIICWTSIIPYIGWIPSLWLLVVLVVALQVVMGLSKRRAIIAGAILFCSWLIFFLVLMIIGIAAKKFTDITKRHVDVTEKYMPETERVPEMPVSVEENMGEEPFKIINKLPEDFPDDIPVYKGAKLASTMAIGDGKSLNLTTDASFEEVKKYYKEELKKRGWETTVMEAEGYITIAAYKVKDERGLTVAISGGTSVGGAAIMIIYKD